MKYEFDKVINRLGTDSTKWEHMPDVQNIKQVLPMWIADMDFTLPPPIVEVIEKRAKHGIYGYTSTSSRYWDSIISWYKNRHNFEIQEDWLVHSPGVLPAISIAIQAFTKPNDKVILQTPVYPPFFRAITHNDRIVFPNQLKEIDGSYVMDYHDLENHLDDQVKMMILCSPHNPGGRVWQKDELIKLGNICLRHHILVVADEIHCDLLYDGYIHHPFASLNLEFAQNSITCISPSKTFNMGGLTTSATIIPNPDIRTKFTFYLEKNELHVGNLFGMTALEAAYRNGEDWLAELLIYVQGNYHYLQDFLKEKIPGIKPMRPESTYLVWLDCKALNLPQAKIMDLLINQAKVKLTDGATFGPGGEGFVRMNIACPRTLLREGLDRIAKALDSFPVK